VDNKIRLGIAIMVSIIWAANVILGMIPSIEYEPQEAVNGLFLVVVGYLFTTASRGKNDKE
jgi:hypothetical protein